MTLFPFSAPIQTILWGQYQILIEIKNPTDGVARGCVGDPEVM